MSAPRSIPELVHLARGRLRKDVDPELVRDLLRDMADALEEQGEALNQRGHVVDIGRVRFGLEHPVECRKAGLLNCPVAKALQALDSPPRPVGRYPVELNEDGSLWFGEAIAE